MNPDGTSTAPPIKRRKYRRWRRWKNRKETLAAIRDAEEGRTEGPFNSVEELTRALESED